MMSVNFVDLSLFLNVLEAGSITEGARRSYLSLTAASERIRNLEQRLDTALLVRHRSGVEPTTAGLVLRRHARRVLEEVALLDTELARRGATSHLLVRVAGNTGAAADFLLDAVATMIVEHPGIDIVVEQTSSHKIVQALTEGHIEFGVVADSVCTGDLALRRLRPDPLVVLGCDEHLPQAESKTRFAGLLDRPFVGLSRDNALQAHLVTQARRLGRRIDYRLRVPDIEAVLRFVAEGVGITILPRAVIARRDPASSLRQSAIDEDWANRNAVLCTRSFDDLSEPARHFIAAIEAACAGGAG